MNYTGVSALTMPFYCHSTLLTTPCRPESTQACARNGAAKDQPRHNSRSRHVGASSSVVSATHHIRSILLCRQTTYTIPSHRSHSRALSARCTRCLRSASFRNISPVRTMLKRVRSRPFITVRATLTYGNALNSRRTRVRGSTGRSARPRSHRR